MSNLLLDISMAGDYKLVSFSGLISILNHDNIKLPATLNYGKQYSCYLISSNNQDPNMWYLISSNKLPRYSYKYSLMEIFSRRYYYNDLYDASLVDAKYLLNLVSRKLLTLDNIGELNEDY